MSSTDSVGGSTGGVYQNYAYDQTVQNQNPQEQRVGTPDAPQPFSINLTGAGQASVPTANLQGIDWNATIDNMGAMNLSVSTTAMMTMLVEITAQMRQDSRQAAFEQMTNSLEEGLAAADELKEAARAQFIASAVSSGISVVGAGAGAAAATGKLSKFKTFENANEAGLSQAFTTAGNAFGQGAGAASTQAADMSRADSKTDEAQAQYAEALQSQNRDFMNQMRDSIEAAMSSMKSVNQAQHDASNAIYGM